MYPILMRRDVRSPDAIVDTDRLLFNVAEVAKVPLRIDGNFSGQAYFLTDTYDWRIGRDDKGELVLVPTLKKL